VKIFNRPPLAIIIIGSNEQVAFSIINKKQVDQAITKTEHPKPSK